MIGTVLGNRYEIVEKIGEGGMALVYKAKCNLLNRYVAVKILREEFTKDEKFIENFRRESQAAASLSHPGIVGMYDVGVQDDNIHYIVMEYVEGETLSKIIKEEGKLSIIRAVDIAKQIALALEHAHKNHIIHRDIKPHNILITYDWKIKVADFGIAKAVTSSTITNSEDVIGSVHYFSPEQARGGYVDDKSDIYSLGIVLYEMVTGSVPFQADSPISIALKHINDEIKPPSSINDEIPKSLESIILKATQKNQVRRYKSAREFYIDLEKVSQQPYDYYASYEDIDSPTQVIPSIKDDEIIADNDYTEIDEDDFDNEYYENEYTSRKNKKRNKIIVYSAIASALLVAFIVSNGILFFKGLFFPKQVIVPKIVGMQYTKAITELEGIGLNTKLESEEYNSLYNEGYIISQIPRDGSTVKKGYTVKYVVSKGEKMTTVPALVNKKLEDAILLLENNNLSKTIKYEYSDLPEGIVIRQGTKANTEISEKEEISLVVSKGVEVKTILMINLLEKTKEDAIRDLESAGLKYSEIKYEYSDEYKKNTVIFQSISAGKEIKENSVVTFTVSKGPENETIETTEDQDNNNSGNNSNEGNDNNDITNDDGNNVDTLNKVLLPPLIYNQAKQDVFTLKIEKEENGVKETLYEKLHEKKNSGKEQITIEGKGKATIYIYFDGELVAEKKLDFETGQFYE